jgi:hypothetical protein
MKEHLKCIALLAVFLFAPLKANKEVAQAWIGLAIAVAGAASSAYGASQNKKAGEANESAAAQARQDELDRRAAAGIELKKAYKAYEDMRKDRPGITFGQFKNEYVKGITDKGFAEAFRAVKEDDFVFAQKIADLATAANVQNFERSAESVSGGAYNQLRDTQNDIALTADSESAVKRALELRSAYIPAGSVRTDSQGRFVEGQRADKQVFTTAYEQDLAARDRQFRMSRDLSNDYASIAERQQERAKDFINFGSLEPVARGFVTQAINNSVAFQQQDEQNQFQLIRDYTNATYSNQTQTPQYQNPNAYNQMISAGIDTATKGIAQYANSSGGGKSGSQTSSADSYFGHGGYSGSYL